MTLSKNRNFNFPYAKPYDIQLELMTAIYDAIETKKIAFLESPTGTGKTLSLLCGTLSWLVDQEKQISSTSTASSSSSTPTASASDNASSNEPEWLRKARAASSTSTTEPDTVIQPLKRARKTPTTSKQSATTVAEKFANLVALMLEDDESSETGSSESGNLRANNFDLPIRNLKVYYCSRTHSQLNQVMSELEKTRFFKGPAGPLQFASAIASRAQLCINQDVKRKHSTNTAITQACQDLLDSEETAGCPYFNHEKDAAFKEHLLGLQAQKIADIEDLVEYGVKNACCPYFSGRYLLGPANLVTLPYNAVLQRSTRQSLGIDLQGSIVVFDEAHNIIDFVKQLNSVSISEPEKTFAHIHQSISAYLDRYYNRLSGANLSALSQLQTFFKLLQRFCGSTSQKVLSPHVWSLNEFIHAAGIESFNFSQLSNHIEDTKLFIKIFGKDQNCDFYAISSLLVSLESSSQEGKIVFDTEKQKLSYICLDVRSAFADVLEQCRAVLFCGGTMSPLSDAIRQIIPKSMHDRVVSKKVGHLVNAKNVLLKFVSKSVNNINFNFSYEKRHDAKMIKDLGLLISNYSRVIPDGLVVFFTSFAYLEEIVGVWKTSGIYSSLNSIKPIFVESKGEQVDTLLARYEEAIRTGRGGLMLAVMNGKLSEGINFSDALGRGVMVIGLPYPNIHDLEVKENLAAYTTMRLEEDPSLERKWIQSEFLENACMRVVNQSIGRAIRHKDDYATMLLIDERFNRESIRSKLPDWLMRNGGTAEIESFSESLKSVIRVTLDF